jgi:hypothetical protein
LPNELTEPHTESDTLARPAFGQGRKMRGRKIKNHWQKIMGKKLEAVARLLF